MPSAPRQLARAQGAVVGVRPRYSDLCLLVLLRAYRPERFRQPSDSSSHESASPPSVVQVSYVRATT